MVFQPLSLKELINSQVDSLCSPFSFPPVVLWSWKSLQKGACSVIHSLFSSGGLSSLLPSLEQSDLWQTPRKCKYRSALAWEKSLLVKIIPFFCSLMCFTGKVCLVCQVTADSVSKGSCHVVPPSLLGKKVDVFLSAAASGFYF